MAEQPWEAGALSGDSYSPSNRPRLVDTAYSLALSIRENNRRASRPTVGLPMRQVGRVPQMVTR